VKSFIGNLNLRQVPLRGSSIGSLNLPLVATIGITGREREREGSPAHKKNNKIKLE
jgi:hypothetical protein